MRDADDTRHAIPDDTTPQTSTTAAPSDAPSDVPPDAPLVLLQIDAARHAGVSVRTIQRAIDRRDLAATRDGGHCWIQIEDLDRWQRQRTTRRTPPHVVARDTDASRVATRGMSGDASQNDTLPRQRTDPDVERLRAENADLKVERDRWHQAFERESALREEETRQLRQLIQQEQALSFSRFAAIEATTRHDTSATDALAGSAETMQETAVGTRHNTNEASTENSDPGGGPPEQNWRRWLRRITGSA